MCVKLLAYITRKILKMIQNGRKEMKTSKPKKKLDVITRVQFELSVDKLNELEALMHEVNVKTKKALINNALCLLKWAVKEVKKGRIIASVDEKAEKFTELNMPVLSAVQVSSAPV